MSNYSKNDKSINKLLAEGYSKFRILRKPLKSEERGMSLPDSRIRVGSKSNQKIVKK